MKHLALIALGALAASTATAHAKTPIYVGCVNPDDSVGMQLCTALKDAIAASPRYELKTAITQKTDYYFEVQLVSVPATDKNVDSAASVAFTLETPDSSIFLNHEVVVTGSAKVREQAQTVLSSMDDNLSKLAAAK